MKISKRTLLRCLLILAPFVVLFSTALYAFLSKTTSLNFLVDYRYPIFLLLFLIFLFLHSFYLFRRNIRWASICIILEVMYSLGLLLGLVAVIELTTNIEYGSEIPTFFFCSILLNVFFSYLFFGLAAKDYYKRPRGTSVSTLLITVAKKHLFLFINILVPLVLVLSCTVILGFDFFVGITSLLFFSILVSAVSGLIFSSAFYLVCLEKLN